ncbi:MAG: cyclic nucleotide-binding domain-containing protein [Pseudomonadota bacterium]|nr:cyclic nucleotide-binding domain-containing protein [Pseudomonadota bacterium]
MAVNPGIDFHAFLHSAPALAKFRPQELQLLEQIMILDDYPDGHEFISEYRTNDQVFLIVGGEVVATHQRAHLRGLDEFDRLGPGELFGLLSLLDRRLPWATFRANGPVTAASLPIQAVELLFRTNARIGYLFQHLIALQLAHNVRDTGRLLEAQFADIGGSPAG